MDDEMIEEWVRARRRSRDDGGFSEKVMDEIRGDVIEPRSGWGFILARVAMVALAALLGGARVLLWLEGVLAGAN